jgi:hypothetical protein
MQFLLSPKNFKINEKGRTENQTVFSILDATEKKDNDRRGQVADRANGLAHA